jgi:hypothetical protein
MYGVFGVFFIGSFGIAETFFKHQDVSYGVTVGIGIALGTMGGVTQLWLSKTHWSLLTLASVLVAFGAAIAAIALLVGYFVAGRPWYEALAAFGVFAVSSFVALYSLKEGAFACPNCGRHMAGQPPYLRCEACV